jgi:hypothetical protein
MRFVSRDRAQKLKDIIHNCQMRDGHPSDGQLTKSIMICGRGVNWGHLKITRSTQWGMLDMVYRIPTTTDKVFVLNVINVVIVYPLSSFVRIPLQMGMRTNQESGYTMITVVLVYRDWYQ